jgi:hypothetical protein
MSFSPVILPGRTRSETRALETVTVENILPMRTRSEMRSWNKLFRAIERMVDRAFLPLFRQMDNKELLEALRTGYAQEREL